MTVDARPTPYGEPALAMLREVVASCKGGDPMSLVTVIVPNNIAGIVARRHLAHGVGPGTSGVAGINVTTLPRLAERVAASLLAPRRPSTRPIVAAAWRAALRRDPGVFGELASHPATVRALSAAYRELRDLSDAALDLIAPTTRLTGDVVRLHREVVAALAPDYYDAVELMDAAAAPASQPGRVVLFLPQRLSNAETRFIKSMANGGAVTVIAGFTGVRRADATVRATLQRLGADEEPPDAPRVAGHVITASDADDEVRCVVREVVETLRTVPAHRVAVLYAKTTPYARLLREQFAAAGVTVNGPGTRPAAERAVARTFTEVLALPDTEFPRGDLFRALANAPTRDVTGVRLPLARWDRVSRSAGVVGGEDWGSRLGSYIEQELAIAEAELGRDEPREWLIARNTHNAETAQALRTFVDDLRTRFAAAAAMTTWRELATWARALFTSLIGELDELRRLPSEEQHAAATVLTLLDSMATLDPVDTAASLAGLRETLDLELASATPRVGRFGDGVLVASVSAAVGLNLDVVYVLGLSEDLYPGRLGIDALLPAAARSATDEIPNARDKLDEKQRHLLVAFASAGRRVVASFPRGDLRRSTRRLPSRFLLPSLRALAGDTSLAATEWDSLAYGDAATSSGSFAGELLATSLLGTEQEWRTRAAAAGRLDDVVVEGAVALIRARASAAFTRFDGNLSGVTGLPDHAIGDDAISPTAMESYAGCPHAYFVQRLLGVTPLEQPEDLVTISAADIGNLVHQTFDALVSGHAEDLPGVGEPWTPEHRARLTEIAEEKAAAFEQQGLTGHPRLWEGERIRILNDLALLLEDDDAWRSDEQAEVLASELAFGMRGQPPVEVAVPQGRVLMRGSADKVDRGADGTVWVTDIKTGSPRSFEEISPDDPFVGGTKLQLPVYALAARERYGDGSSPTRAQYWFVRRDRGTRIELELTDELHAAYAEALGVLVGSIAQGMFPPMAPETADFAWVQCPYCNPDGIGHSENRERWEVKRHDPALTRLVALIDRAATQDGLSS